MSFTTARIKINQRVKNELIGPGSDIFLADEDYQMEIIEGKPLTRYFSGILFPRKKPVLFDDAGENDFTQEDQNLSSEEHQHDTPESGEESENSQKTSVNDSDD